MKAARRGRATPATAVRTLASDPRKPPGCGSRRDSRLARVPGRDGHDGVLPLRPGEAGLGLAVAQYPLLAEDLVRDDALSVGLSLLLDHLGALHPQVDAHDPPLGCDPRLRE